jgi:hypothetical protein
MSGKSKRVEDCQWKVEKPGVMRAGLMVKTFNSQPSTMNFSLHVDMMGRLVN